MINLIPPVARKAIVTEYWVRVTSIWLFVLSAVNIVILLLALPVYVLVISQVESYAQSATEAEQRVADYDLSAGSLIRANVAAQKIFELRDIEYFSDVVTQIESVQGSNIIIEGMSFGRKDKALAPVRVTGEAADRQALAGFRDRLIKQENIAEVDLPISNLAKDKDLEFSLSIVFKEES